MSESRSYLNRMLSGEATEPKALPLSLLKEITDDFAHSREIGHGGYAIVYLGVLENGVVAVKRLRVTKHVNAKKFNQEIECLMKADNKNIVRFLGYCDDTKGNVDFIGKKPIIAGTKERLLCFEYLPRTLEYYIGDPSHGLEWKDRYRIIKGICEGLHHLHEKNILHLDLKPDNILLGEDLEPKITDFGISRSFHKDQTRDIVTHVTGTTGYMAPEFSSKVVTKKNDLYSLGVVLSEIITGGRKFPGVETVHEIWTKRCNTSHKEQELKQIRVCVQIVIECTNHDPANRPVNMKDIIKRLAETESMEPTLLKYPQLLKSMDAHPTEPWFLIGHFNGKVSVWNYESKTLMVSFRISERPVYSIKFHSTKRWIVAGTGDNLIHVYDCACVTKVQNITCFRAPNAHIEYPIGIHPTKPYVLSASMKLWDGDKGWECTHTFGTGGMLQVAFNPENPVSFARASHNNFVEVWSLDSPQHDYTLDGHSDRVNCLDFFKLGDQQHLITGSDDCTAKIWDLKTKACIHTMQAFTTPVIHVISVPGRPYLVTCSKNATLHVWSSTVFRLKKIVNFSGGGMVYSLVCFMGSRRIAIGQQWTISILDIDDEDECYNEGQYQGVF